MAQVIADRRDLDFVLYDQFGADTLKKTKKFKGQDKKMFDMIISEARTLGINEILPLNEIGDRTGLRFEDNRVFGPPEFRKAHDLFREGEYFAMSDDPEAGGMGLPHMVSQAVKEYLIGADFCASGILIGCHGTGKMVELFGTDKQKELYLEKLYTGQWTGTMVLTEPEAGSDVGALTTTAVPNGDGTYSISGNKIFISGGEHESTPNIVHTVLARIEGAPAGTKGISLFIVPKVWVHEDGSLGDNNDVVCTGIEEKMGLHASPTCQMTFGGKGQCKGLLLGEENKGMQVMFSMMNEARLDIGALGLYNASCAYLYAANYARERLQGRDLENMMDKDAPSVAIVRHPDVRRMLLWMKTHVEGMRSFVYYISYLFDKEACAETEDEKAYYHNLVELLTPVVKSYCTDRGFEATVHAMQVYGGYGYTKDYPIERLMRDSKINSIYEGTNGIQAMDFLGRKMGMKQGSVFMNFLSEIQKIVTAALEIPGLESQARSLEGAVNALGETAMQVGKTAMSAEFKTAFSFASPFLEAVGDVIMAWMLLWRATIAEPKLRELVGGMEWEEGLEVIKSNKNAAFYEGQIQSAKYFIEAILPVTRGRLEAVKAGSQAVMAMPEESFGG